MTMRTIKQLVEQEVIYNVSELVRKFGKKDYEYFYREPDIDQFRETFEESGRTREDLAEWDYDIDDLPEYELHEWQVMFADTSIDYPEYDEVLEHWIVTDWFANKLAARGECVIPDFHGLTIWGRTCSGQAIYLDGVVQEIYNELKK